MKIRAFTGTASGVVFFDRSVTGSGRQAQVKPAVMDAGASGASRRGRSALRLRLPSLADEVPRQVAVDARRDDGSVSRDGGGGRLALTLSGQEHAAGHSSAASAEWRAALHPEAASGEGYVAMLAAVASGEWHAAGRTPSVSGEECAASCTWRPGKPAAVVPVAGAGRLRRWAANVFIIGALCLALGHAHADAAARQGRRQLPADMAQPAMSLSWQAPSVAALRELMREAEQHYQQKRDDEALSIFSSLIELSPEHRAEALLRVGNIRQRNGSPGAAVDLYRQLLEMQPVDGPRESGKRKPGQSGGGSAQADAGHAQRLQAARLKALVNLSVMSLEQGREAITQLRAMPQDPALWQAAGMNAQTTQALVDNLLSQVAQIQQILAGTAAGPTARAAGMSAEAMFGTSGMPGAAKTRGRSSTGHRHSRHSVSTPDFIIGRPLVAEPAAGMAANAGQMPSQVQASAWHVDAQDGGESLHPGSLHASHPVREEAPGRPVVEYRIKPETGISAVRRN